jgi:hypothetical protein
MASATAAYYLSQQVGQIIGTSVSTAALQQMFHNRLDIDLDSISLPNKDQVNVVLAVLLNYGILTSL